MAVAVPAYIAVLIALNDGVAHKLSDLVEAIEPAAAGIVGSVKALRIQAEQNNQDTVLVGDLNVSLTRYGEQIIAHDQSLYSSPVAIEVPYRGMYVMAASVTSPVMQISVEIFT